MTDNKDRNEPGNVQGALDSIQEMKRAALWRAMPPRRFGAIIALLAGALVALSVAGLREYHVYIIILIALVLLYQSKKPGVSVRQLPSKLTGIALIILIPLFFLLIVAAQTLSDRLGYVWASLSAGLVLAIAVYTLSVFERRRHLNRVGAEKGE